MFYGNKILRTWMLISVLAILAGCSGGGEGDVIGTGGKPKVQISGTAAEGAPIGDASVTVKAEDGVKKSTRTLSNGRFQIEAEGAGPFLMRVEKGGGKSLFSIASRGGNTNIHPFTDLIIRNWFKVQGLDLESEFDSAVAPAMLPTPAEIADIENAIRRIIQQALIRFGLPGELDLISAPFDANSTGFDLFLDFSSVVINNNTINIVLTDQETNIENPVVSDVDLATDFTEADNTAPDMPENLRAVPASASEIVVVWDPTTDNVGVAGYRVYRNGELVETTPYPVYFDSGLSPNTPYCYQIEAFDGAENSSVRAETPQPCPLTLGSDDTTAPATPTDVIPVVESANAISLSWTQTVVNDVYGFYIYRGATENNIGSEPIAIVTSTKYTDFDLLSSTQYCYQVSAFDAATPKNESGRSSPVVCATTEAGSNPSPTGEPRVEFTSATYTVSEMDGTVMIAVKRDGDASEEISVGYSVSGGTATADLDFVETTGVLTWAANDVSDKTFLVQIKGDAVSESTEAINVDLVDESPNVSLDNISSATISITDEECPGRITSGILESRVISECTVVTSSIPIGNNAGLTINPGVTMIFEDGAGFEVRAGSYLKADGTEQQPITFTSNNNPLLGAWRGIQYSGSVNINNVLDYVTLEYAGTGINQPGGLVLFSDAQVSISNSIFRMNSNYGINFYSGFPLGEFVNNVISENELNPIRMSALYLHKLDENSLYSGNGVDEILVTGGVISEGMSHIWPSIDVDYNVGSLLITGTLTISPGATIKFGTGGYLNFQGGSLNAVGTEANPITFTSNTLAPGSWDGLQFSNSSNSVLDYVIVEYAGPGVNQPGGIVMMGGGARLSIKNSTIRNNSSYGVNDFSNNTIVEFTNNTVTENESYPMRLNARNVPALDATSSFVGNSSISGASMDELYVINGNVNAGVAVVWRALDVPYLAGDIHVSDPLTIEQGATILMRSQTQFNVRSSGSLTAQGNELQGITFTGAENSPGFWEGIRFEDSNNVNNIIDYVTVNDRTVCYSSTGTVV